MNRQTGYSLIEIMIALLLGLIIVGTTLTLYISTVRGSSDTIRSARLNHDLDSAMQLMINDIRRAGYWGGAVAGADSKTNPFTAATTNIQIHGGNCILYSYDANDSGVNTPGDTTDDVDANEHYGFKLDGTNIRMRRSGATTAAAGCANGAPNDWVTMNVDTGGARSERVEIDSLTFDFDDVRAPSKCKNVTTNTTENKSCATTAIVLNSGNNIAETRQVFITLTGHITGETAVSKTLTGTVKVRNDRIFTQP